MRAKKANEPKVVAQFLLGQKVIHEIVSDKSSVGGYSVKLGPGHYMGTPLRSVEEVLAYGRQQGFTAVAV